MATKINNDKWYTIYKKVTIMLGIIILPYLIGVSGLITWRNNRPNHLIYLYITMKDALDKNEVLDGLLNCKSEFIFNLINLGCWIKFAVLLLLFITVIKFIPKVFAFAYKFAVKSEAPVRKSIAGISSFIHIASKINIGYILECIFRYHIFPSTKSPFSMVAVSLIKDEKIYYGGFKVDMRGCKFPKLHLISSDGIEINHVMSHPIVAIPTRSSLYICGRFSDENDTKQRKKMLNGTPMLISIGDEKYTIQAML